MECVFYFPSDATRSLLLLSEDNIRKTQNHLILNHLKCVKICCILKKKKLNIIHPSMTSSTARAVGRSGTIYFQVMKCNTAAWAVAMFIYLKKKLLMQYLLKCTLINS